MKYPKDNYEHPSVTKIGGHNIIGGLNRVYHCNFYNAYLQMAVLLTRGVGQQDPSDLLTDSVTPLIKILKQNGYTNLDLIQEFSYCGFGILEQLDELHWQTPRSHYGEVLCSHSKPHNSCYFTAGYIQGIVDKKIEEVECKLLDTAADKFIGYNETISLDNYLIYDFALQTEIPQVFAFDGCQEFNTQVDEVKIISELEKIPLCGNYNSPATGLIEVFNTVLTNHFADYYNRISYETYFALCDAGIPEEDSKEMFIQAGHVCAFNTFGRIMCSTEWYNLIVPMCQNKDDWLHGMVAIINILGWGVYRIEKIEVEKELIMRVYNSYEGIGFRRMYLPEKVGNDKNTSFLAMGAILGLAHLLWKIDIRDKPELTQDFYVKQFNNPDNSYIIEQTDSIITGDNYDRFIVSK
ncbi:MAG: hypothetical protein KAH84_04865 [Thiomargarita sp.]|nr:hypothetical protein [Thiomargarita sp.]